MSISSSLISELAPTGRLRASINLGNRVLAHSQTSDERPAGVSIDLARELGRELGVEVSFLEFDGAAKSALAVSADEADVGFLAFDPMRSAGIHFSPAYLHIEGVYLVRNDSPLQCNADVDRAGHRIVVGAGSAYELYLSREIKAAELVKVARSEDVVDGMLYQDLEVAAGVRQQMEADARRTGGVRLLDERFMVIRQAMTMPKARSAAAAAALDDFVERMKRCGFVAAALKRHGIAGAKVADD